LDCGVEGPTDDPQVNALRNRQKRNFLSTLFLSQGVPMLLGGDEIGRTQKGNNNAYCQDNFLVRLELSGYDFTRIRAPAYSAAQRASGVRASGFKAAPFTAQKARTSAGSPVRFSAVRSS
jgi:pullulanase/glycogen debranching enzyme